MDMNQPTTPPVNPINLAGQAQATSAVPPSQTVPPVSVNAPQEPMKQDGSRMLLIVALLVIVVAILVGAYFFMSNQRTSEDAVGKTSYKQPTAQSQGEFSSLENESNAIDVESNDSDFASVDKDLQSL